MRPIEPLAQKVPELRPEPKPEAKLSSLSSTLATAALGSSLSSSSLSSASSTSALFGHDVVLPPAEASSPADKKYREGIEQATQNRLDEAELTLREAVRLDATKPEYLTSLARVLLANPRYERAGTLPVVRSLLDRAVQIAPDNTEANDLHRQVVSEMGS
jgi:tetratricopeptide (TPR) repeat protein